MSKSSSAGMALGALGTVAAIGSSLNAFVTPSAPSVSGASTALRGVSAASASSADVNSKGSSAAVATGLATAAIAVAAVANGRKVKSARSVGVARLGAVKDLGLEQGEFSPYLKEQQLTPDIVPDAPFAGGLIGGESAFAGQDFNFDPLGISVRCAKYLPWFREAELKHGRICMLAFVGLIVPDIVRIPGPETCYSAANVVDAHNACVGNPVFPFVPIGFDNTVSDTLSGTKAGPLMQVYLFLGAIELLTSVQKFVAINNKRGGLTLENAGDYRLGLNFLPKDPMKAKEMKLKELKNGRLAMLAFGGAITQATLSGNGFPWLYSTAQKKTNAGLSANVAAAKSSFTGNAGASQRGSVARCAQAENGYKMSACVPFLPVSPALEGYAGYDEEGFDPMGFTLALDVRWLREAELKHARVAMLAATGWMATDMGLRVPGAPFQVSTLEAHDALTKFGAMPHMLIWLGLAEVFGFLAIINMNDGKTDRKPGDFGLRVGYPEDAKGQYDMQLKELRNGRLAMLAFGGMATVGVLTGDKWPFFATAPEGRREANTSSAFCGASVKASAARTSRAAMAAAEVSASMPFLPKPKNLAGMPGARQEFDPLMFSDVFDVRWLRESELKHGRVCMLATVGFVSEQYFQIPGLESFASDDALKAIYSTPIAYTSIMLLAAGFIENNSYNGNCTMLDMFEGDCAKRAPGDLNFGKQFLPKDSEQAAILQEKELNNGRLAMLAFSGMVHHNLVVSGPLFPFIPDGWAGPEGIWAVESVAGMLNTGMGGE
eukprot:TRINITY_DN364_c0_g1_i1.p1 TRINITY_DN364_c0_g1~~TRINITY_DN364_c0_g1_i1.p1  ORF type:complete len:775 (-),score=199.37 TRINITY_DN364_c0_g1_i1:176-2500(-)